MVHPGAALGAARLRIVIVVRVAAEACKIGFIDALALGIKVVAVAWPGTAGHGLTFLAPASARARGREGGAGAGGRGWERVQFGEGSGKPFSSGAGVGPGGGGENIC